MSIGLANIKQYFDNLKAPKRIGMSDLQREAFESWYKDNVPLIEHTPVAYAIAISAWQACAESNKLGIDGCID